MPLHYLQLKVNLSYFQEQAKETEALRNEIKIHHPNEQGYLVFPLSFYNFLLLKGQLSPFPGSIYQILIAMHLSGSCIAVALMTRALNVAGRFVSATVYRKAYMGVPFFCTVYEVTPTHRVGHIVQALGSKVIYKCLEDVPIFGQCRSGCIYAYNFEQIYIALS